MPHSLKRNIYVGLFLSLLTILSCWEDKESILEPTNNAPSWTSLVYNDSCEIGDTLTIDLLGKAADAEKDSLMFSIIESNIDSNMLSIDSGYLNIIAYQHTSNICSLKITVSDGLLEDTTSFIIKFYKNVKSMIWKDSLFVNKVSELSTCSLNLSSFIIDSISLEHFTYSILKDTNTIDTIIDSTLIISIIDSLASPYTINVLATDKDNNTDTTKFQFIINHAPFWTKDIYEDTCLAGDTLDINLLLLAVDNDFDSLSFEITDSIIKTISSIENGSLHFYAPSDSEFTVSMNIIVSDTILSDTANFIITVNKEKINQKPNWDEASFIDSCASGDSLLINLNSLSSDPENDELSFKLISTGAIGTVNIDSSNLIYKSLSDTTYETSFILEVSDGEFADSATFTINIKETIKNKGPQWTQDIFIDSCIAGDSFSINLDSLSTDPENDPLTFKIIGNNAADAGIENSNILIYNSLSDSSYSISFTLEVSDGELFDSTTFTFNVTKPNAKPEFVTNKPKVLYEIEEGQEVIFELEATDSDADDIITFGISNLGGLPNSSNSNLNSNQFKWTSSVGDNGAYVVIFFATDGKDSTFINTTIKIGEANIAPTITVSDTFANGVATLKENDNLTINFTFSDLDVDDNLVVSQNLPQETGLHFNLASDNKSGVLTFATNYNTVIKSSQKVLDTVKITVSDGEDAATYSLVITINNVNRAPSFDEDSPKDLYTVVAGTSLTIPFSSTDPDSEETATATVDESTLKSGADIQKNSGNIIWNTSINDIGDHSITFNATDGDTTINKEVTVSVSENNDAPAITIESYTDGETITITEEDEVSFKVVATPVLSGDNVTLSKNGDFDPAADYNTANGNFKFTANYDMTSQDNLDSTFTFVFTAKGSATNAAVAQFTIKIKVTNVNRAPRFTLTPRDTTIGIGNEYSAVLTVVDDDSDPLDISFTDSRVTDKNGNPYWLISNITEELGGFLSVGAVVNDGDTTVYSDKWRIDIIEHQWKEIISLDSIVDVVAGDMNNIYVFLPDYKVACYSSDGSFQWQKDHSTMDATIVPFGAKIYNDKIIYRSRQNGGGAEMFNVFKINNSSIDSLGKYTNYSRTSFYGAYSVSNDSLFIGQAFEIEAARTGLAIFGFTLNGLGDFKITRLLDGFSIWDTLTTFADFRDLDIASNNGDIIYFINNSNELYISKNSRTMTSFVNQPITNAPTDIKNVYSLNDSTAWAVTNTGSVHFTAHYFENNNHYKEKIGAVGQQIQKVAIPYNKDGVLAISNKKVYMY